MWNKLGLSHDVCSDFLCESILGEDMKVKFRKYFICLDFEVLKALKQLIVRKNCSF